MKARQWNSAARRVPQSSRLLGWATGHVVLVALGLSVSLFVLSFVGREVFRPAVIIEVVAVPKVMQEAGLDAEVVTQHVLDRIDDIENENYEMGALAKPKSFRDAKEQELPAYDIPGFHVSTRDVIKILRNWLGRDPTTVNISVSQTDTRKFQLQIHVRPSGGQGQTLPLEPAVEKYEAVAEQIARGVLSQLDPAQLGTMLYVTNGEDYSNVLQQCVDRLARDKKVQCLLAWGEIEADGEHDLMARKRFNQALKFQSNAPDILSALGDIEQSLGNLAGAREYYRRAEKAGLDQLSVHVNHATLLQADGDVRGAIRELQQARGIGKPNAELLTWLASLQHEHKQKEDSIQTFSQAMDADPRRALTMSAWGHVLLMDSNVADGTENDNVADGMEKIATAKRLMAIRLANRAHVDAEISKVWSKMGEKTQAIQMLKDTFKLLAPSSSSVLRSLASAEAETEGTGTDDGIQLLRGAIKDDPVDWRAYVTLGDLLDRKKNNQDEAIACWKKAIALNPYAYDARLSLGSALARDGDDAGAEQNYLKAVELYQQAIEKMPDSPDLRFKLFGLFLQLKKYADAKVVLTAVERLDHPEARLSMDWGVLYYWQGQLPEAEKNFRVAIKYDPQDASGRWYLANTLAQLGDFVAAKTEVDEVIHLQPDFTEAKEFQKRLMQISHFRAAIQYDPQDALSHCMLAYLSAQLGDYAFAKTEVDEAIFLRPDTPGAKELQKKLMQIQ